MFSNRFSFLVLPGHEILILGRQSADIVEESDDTLLGRHHDAKKIHAGTFRIYANVQNPFTFTEVELIDPETKGTHTTYPMFKTYSVGLNISF